MPLITDLPNSGATIATIAGPRSWERPFDDLTDELVLTQAYIQTVEDFRPLALDTPHDDLPDAYLVAESPRENIGGLYKWTRTYARIPPSRQVFESYSWLVPGIGSGAIYAAQSISSATNAAGVTTIITSGSSGVALGDQASIAYTFTDAQTGTQYGRTVIRTALAGTSGTTIAVALIAEPGGTITYQTLKKVEPGRPAEAVEVSSSLQLDYFLPGVSPGVTTPFDIPRISALEIYDGDGVKVNSFTASTSPTLAAWRALVAARSQVCVVSSVIRRWQGNIYERSTRYCVAQ